MIKTRRKGSINNPYTQYSAISLTYIQICNTTNRPALI